MSDLDLSKNLFPSFNITDGHWRGKVPHVDGGFWTPNVASVEALASAGEWGKGLGASVFTAARFAYLEVDRAELNVQWLNLKAFTLATGLEWAMIIYSGNKSLHAYLRFTTPLALPEREAERLLIQQALAVYFRGDPRITGVHQKMREPGFKSESRNQPVVYTSAASYESHHIIAALKGLLGLNEAGIVEAFSLMAEGDRLLKRRDSTEAERAAARHMINTLSYPVDYTLEQKVASRAERVASEPATGDFAELLAEYKARGLSGTMACSCPLHEDIHPSAFIYSDGRGFECSSCGYKVFFPKEEKDRSTAPITAEFPTANRIVNMELGDSGHVIIKPFVADITAIYVKKGGGKTFGTAKVLADMEDYERVIITPRKELTKEASVVFNTGYYLADDPDFTKSIAITINSVEKVNRNGRPYILVLDEVTLTFRSMVLGQVKAASIAPVYRALSRLIREAAHVVVIDADLTEDILSRVAMIRGAGCSVELRTADVRDDREFTVYRSRKMAQLELMSRIEAGQKVFVACSTADLATNLAAKGRELGKRAIAITRPEIDKPNSEAKAALDEGFTSVLAEHDLITASTVISTGVSGITPVDCVFIFAEPGVGVLELDQLSARARINKSGEYHLYVSDVNALALPTNRAELWAYYEAQEEAFRQAVNEHIGDSEKIAKLYADASRTLMIFGQIKGNDELLDLFFASEAVQNRTGGNRTACRRPYLARLELAGLTKRPRIYTKLETEARLKASAREAQAANVSREPSKKLRADKVARVISSTPVDSSDLSRRPEDESDEFRSARILALAGAITPFAVEVDIRIGMNEAVASLRTALDTEEAAIARDLQQSARGEALGGVRRRTAARALVHAALDIYGLEPGTLLTVEPEYRPEILEPRLAIFMANKTQVLEAAKLFGVQLSGTKKHYSLLTAALRCLGVASEVKRVRVGGGKQVRRLSITAEGRAYITHVMSGLKPVEAPVASIEAAEATVATEAPVAAVAPLTAAVAPVSRPSLPSALGGFIFRGRATQRPRLTLEAAI
jgi:hypothetical protein